MMFEEGRQQKIQSQTADPKARPIPGVVQHSTYLAPVTDSSPPLAWLIHPAAQSDPAGHLKTLLLPMSQQLHPPASDVPAFVVSSKAKQDKTCSLNCLLATALVYLGQGPAGNCGSVGTPLASSNAASLSKMA